MTDSTNDVDTGAAAAQIADLQHQLADLTERNAALTQANDDLSLANEEHADTIKALAAQVNALKGDIATMLEVPAVDVGAIAAPAVQDLPDEVHAQLAADPNISAAAGLSNGMQPETVRQRLVDAAHRMGAFLEGGLFHKRS